MVRAISRNGLCSRAPCCVTGLYHKYPFFHWRIYWVHHLPFNTLVGLRWLLHSWQKCSRRRMTDGRWHAILLHWLGPEGQSLLYALSEQGTSVDKAMAVLGRHIVTKGNVLVRSHIFRQCVQCANDTLSQHVATLRALAAPCGFGVMKKYT